LDAGGITPAAWVKVNTVTTQGWLPEKKTKKHVFDPDMNIFQRLVGCAAGTVSMVMIANSYIIIGISYHIYIYMGELTIAIQ
jgi:hypothetical protein